MSVDVLLDTHVVLWWLADDQRLSETMRARGLCSSRSTRARAVGRHAMVRVDPESGDRTMVSQAIYVPRGLGPAWVVSSAVAVHAARGRAYVAAEDQVFEVELASRGRLATREPSRDTRSAETD